MTSGDGCQITQCLAVGLGITADKRSTQFDKVSKGIPGQS